jgi:hypothetical protein
MRTIKRLLETVKKANRLFVLMTLFFVQPGCAEGFGYVTSISIDFPHGETRLLIQRDGEALLFYGALPQHRIVKKGTFDVDEVYSRLQSRLHENVPREDWPDPKSKAGMVTISFADKTKKDYLIFDGEYARLLFDEAESNVIGTRP